MEDGIGEFYKNLSALTETAFPKQCNNCGEVYKSPEDFVAKTQAITGKSGLKGTYDDDDRPIVELYRNCVCGSTLMDFFSDRRDCSEKGIQRRQLFDRLLVTLMNHQIPREQARAELIKVLRGGESELINRFGNLSQQ